MSVNEQAQQPGAPQGQSGGPGRASGPAGPQGRADDGEARANTTRHAGYPAPSDTYNPRDQGTDWPPDAFTAMILSPGPTEQLTPARHSYDGDGNMEAYEIAGPYAVDNEASRDLGTFTGATGPTGHVTPAARPEVTVP